MDIGFWRCPCLNTSDVGSRLFAREWPYGGRWLLTLNVPTGYRPLLPTAHDEHLLRPHRTIYICDETPTQGVVVIHDDLTEHIHLPPESQFEVCAIEEPFICSTSGR